MDNAEPHFYEAFLFLFCFMKNTLYYCAMNQTLQFKIFSKAIRQKRIIELDINVREAATQIGISFSTLSRCENERMPELLAYANICKWLGVSMDTFISKAKTIKNNSTPNLKQ